MTVTVSGYSGTPLAKKLGIKSGDFVQIIGAPDYYLQLFTDLPDDIMFDNGVANKINFIHFFTKEKSTYFERLPSLKDRITQNGIIWISWPKKASKMITDLNENDIRNYAIRIGLVDIKVCAVDAIWSGLKLVIPVKDRVK